MRKTNSSSETKVGGKYGNRDGKLPQIDKKGNAIHYQEYDVNNKIAGKNRDAERFIRGNNGSVYYTKDHYNPFMKIK